MERFEVRAGQFGLLEGNDQASGELISAAEGAAPLTPEGRKGRLYLVVEADGDGARGVAACKLALRVFRRAFYDDQSFSATAALRAALRATNKALYEHNFNLPATERVTVGCTAAVLREGTLYVAQVQPAQAYVLSEGRLRALPAHPVWDPAAVSAALFARSGALGASLFIEPELFRCPLRAGEGAIMCSSAFSGLLSRADVETLLRPGDARVAATHLKERALAAGLVTAYALILTVESVPRRRPAGGLWRSGDAPAQPNQSRPASPWFSGLAQRLGWRTPPATPAPEPAPDPLYTMPAQPAHSPAPPSRPAPLDIGESLGERYARSREQPARAPLRSENLPPSVFLGEADPGADSPRRIDLADTQALSQGRPYQPRYIHRPLVDMTWKERLALPFYRLRIAVDERLRCPRARRPAPPRPIPRRHGLSYRRTRPPFPWALLAILSLVVAALIMYGITLTRQNDQQVVMAYFAVADERLNQVRAAPSDGAALEALELTRQAIEQLRASPGVTDTNPPLWLRYQELQREYERALAAIQRLTFFDDPVVLATLPAGRFADVIVPPPTGAITDAATLEASRFLYALDTDQRAARLYRLPRDGGTPVPYLSPGQPVGSAVVGPLRAAVWRIDQVVAVDQALTGAGYYFRTGGAWNYSRLGASEIWATRDRLDVEEYAGNLYVWGAQPNEVLRYRSGSFGDPPDYWLDPASIAEVDLSTVVDMSVDGSIYLLRSNGAVLVFSQGQLAGEVTPEPMTPPLTNVTRFFVTGNGPDNGYFFLLDTLGERIIQMEKVSGKIIQQMKARPDGEVQLAELAGIAVDDGGARPIIYLANAGQIVRAELPPPPRPFRETSPPGP